MGCERNDGLNRMGNQPYESFQESLSGSMFDSGRSKHCFGVMLRGIRLCWGAGNYHLGQANVILLLVGDARE